MDNIETILNNTTEENQGDVNWTSAWSGKYPVLKTYQQEVDTLKYSTKLNEMLQELMDTHSYSRQDAMLVLKDILYHEYKDKK